MSDEEKKPAQSPDTEGRKFSILGALTQKRNIASDEHVTTEERPGGNLSPGIMLLGGAIILVLATGLLQGLFNSSPDIAEPDEITFTEETGSAFNDPNLFGDPEPILPTNQPNAGPDIGNIGIETPIADIALTEDQEQSQLIIAALSAPIRGNTSSFNPLPPEPEPEPETQASQDPIMDQGPPPMPGGNYPPGLQAMIDQQEGEAGAQAPTDPQANVRQTQYVDPTITLMPGSIIPAMLIVEVNSDFATNWIGQVTHPVFDHDIRNLLIPAGSTVTGRVLRYSGENEIIRDTVMLAADTIARPDGALIPVNMPAANADGSGGIEGETNSHFLARSLGTAAFSIFSIIPSLTADGGPAQSARDEAAGEFAQQVGSQFEPLAQRYASLVPTTILAPGTKMRLLVASPIEIEPYGAARREMRYGAIQ